MPKSAKKSSGSARGFFFSWTLQHNSSHSLGKMHRLRESTVCYFLDPISCLKQKQTYHSFCNPNSFQHKLSSTLSPKQNPTIFQINKTNCLKQRKTTNWDIYPSHFSSPNFFWVFHFGTFFHRPWPCPGRSQGSGTPLGCRCRWSRPARRWRWPCDFHRFGRYMSIF